jgi:hypothetical protein
VAPIRPSQHRRTDCVKKHQAQFQSQIVDGRVDHDSSPVTISEANEGVESHNDRLYDGEDVARIDPAIKEELADLVAKDLDLLD